VVIEQTPSAGTKMQAREAIITLTVSAKPGDEGAPPRAPVITAEPQPVDPAASPAAPAPKPDAPPPKTAAPIPSPVRAPAGPGAVPGVVQPSPGPSPPQGGAARRTRVQVVVPEGGVQEVKIVVIDESGVHTIYKAEHGPGDRVEQMVRSQGYTIIQVYVGNALIQEIRP
jgi:hypothetical protein